MPLDLYKAAPKESVGNKAFNLMRVATAGISVPPGFVVSVAETLTDKELISLYKKYITHGKVSVRSSSDKEDGEKKSAAGTYKTLLDVSSVEIGASLLAVRDHSTMSRAIPVIVQKQIDAQVSGVAFSINPMNGDNDIYIEYTAGRCEDVVSGSLIPKTAVLNKKSYEGDGDIPLILFDSIIQLEMIFREPVDIEWCIDHDEKVWILQCRPVTVIPCDSFQYAWSAHEPLWAMEQAFKTRCEDEANRHSGLYLHREIIYSRDSNGVFDCYIGLKDHLSALQYTMTTLGEKYKPIDDTAGIEHPAFFAKSNVVDYFRKLSSLYCQYIRYYMRSEPIVTDIIERKVSLKYSRREMTELLSVGNDDLMFREQDDFLSLRDSGDSSLLRHVKKHPYLAINYITINEMLEGVRAQYTIQSTAPAGVLKDENTLQSRRDEDSDIKLLKKLSVERMKVKKGWAGIYFHMLLLMEWISKNYNVSQHDLYKYYLVDDVVDLVNSDIKLSLKEKSKRDRGVLMKRKKDKNMTPEIRFGKAFYKQDDSRSPLSNAVLYGRPSLNKKVHGVVSVINYKVRIDSRDYRDKIVVTEMTQPNMVSLFRQCKGIITNEGGVLSHACILSREYGIPCIVGTSNATRILKDGDAVIMWPDGHITYDCAG